MKTFLYHVTASCIAAMSTAIGGGHVQVNQVSILSIMHVVEGTMVR